MPMAIAPPGSGMLLYLITTVGIKQLPVCDEPRTRRSQSTQVGARAALFIGTLWKPR
ncbi:hypothetical protein ACVWXO_005588 [Bradyrhizobium sp. LM2.7]